MNEILKMLNELKADELDGLIVRANILLEKKRKEEAEQAQLEKERLRQEKIEQEKRRQQEIAELQSRQPEIPEPVEGNGFGMHERAVPVQTKPTSQPQTAPAPTYCPYCGRSNMADSMFCANCGQRMTAPKAAPRMQTPPTAQPQSGAAQVRCADEGMKKWELRPGEQTMRNRHEIILLQPDGGKFAYHMEITNQRILFYRESTASKNAGMVARMGGGLVGSLIAEDVKAATGSGPKPWLEIPLAAVSGCGLQNKKEFFIVADQNYVLKNKNYEILLPDLVADAKR